MQLAVKKWHFFLSPKGVTHHILAILHLMTFKIFGSSSTSYSHPTSSEFLFKLVVVDAELKLTLKRVFVDAGAETEIVKIDHILIKL